MTLCEPPVTPSDTVVVLKDKEMPVGGSSSSVSVRVAGSTIRAPDEPLTSMVSFTSSTTSSTGFRTNDPCPLALSGSMTMSKPDTSAKSTAVAVPEPVTVTDTVVVAG